MGREAKGHGGKSLFYQRRQKYLEAKVLGGKKNREANVREAIVPWPFHHCATAEKRTASIYQKKIFSFKSLSYCRRARQIDDFCGGCKSTIKNRAVFLRSTENSLFGQELFSLMSSVTHTLVKNSTSGFPLVTFRSQNTSQRLLPTMSDSF